MNARVRAADTGHVHFFPEQAENRRFHALLNGRAVFLYLPAVVIRAIV